MAEMERDSELAQNEDLETLSSALFLALETELSGLGWPGSTKPLLVEAETQVGSLIRQVER